MKLAVNKTRESIFESGNLFYKVGAPSKILCTMSMKRSLALLWPRPRPSALVLCSVAAVTNPLCSCTFVVVFSIEFVTKRRYVDEFRVWTLPQPCTSAPRKGAVRRITALAPPEETATANAHRRCSAVTSGAAQRTLELGGVRWMCGSWHKRRAVTKRSQTRA